MTEITDRLTKTERTFVTHWGEMGTRWGINRTVAQIHALLYMTGRPQNAEDLVSALGVARSNVSTSIKELMGWGLVTLVHIPHDRRDHFTTPSDIWALFRIIITERKRREIDPTVQAINSLVEPEADKDDYAQARLREIQSFLTIMTTLMEQARTLPPATLTGLLSAAGFVSNLLPRKSESC